MELPETFAEPLSLMSAKGKALLAGTPFSCRSALYLLSQDGRPDCEVTLGRWISFDYVGGDGDKEHVWAAVEAARVDTVRRHLHFALLPTHVMAANVGPLPTASQVAGLELQNSAPPEPEGAAPRWPTKLRRDLALVDDPQAQRKIEEKERCRWVEQALDVLEEDEYPVRKLAQGSTDPRAFLRRGFGGRRGSTVRTRVLGAPRPGDAFYIREAVHLARCWTESGSGHFGENLAGQRKMAKSLTPTCADPHQRVA